MRSIVKPWKPDYTDWPVTLAVLASSAVPTLFPVVEGRYVDGGVGSYANPCYVAAYELRYCLGWDPAETTLISLGTGRTPHTLTPFAPAVNHVSEIESEYRAEPVADAPAST